PSGSQQILNPCEEDRSSRAPTLSRWPIRPREPRARSILMSNPESHPGPRRARRRGRRTGLVAALAMCALALVAGLFAGTAGAQSEDAETGPGRGRLTAEQRQCLEDQGLERPARGERPSAEQRQAFRDAAEACGIELPVRRGPVRRFLRDLTEEQRQCLEDQGLDRPARGERPTAEQRQAFRDAAETCGIELPAGRARLTEEQRQCLEDQGLERPARGERPTAEQRQAFRDAAEACGVE